MVLDKTLVLNYKIESITAARNGYLQAYPLGQARTDRDDLGERPALLAGSE